MTSLRTLLVLLLILGVTLPASSATAQTQPTTDPRFFSQTNFRIDNDAFWNFFQGRVGIPTFGFPVSRQFLLDGFQVQIFQRNIMQLQADGGVQTLNLLDPGLMPYTRINGSTFPASDPAVVRATPPVSDPNYDSPAAGAKHIRWTPGELLSDVHLDGQLRGGISQPGVPAESDSASQSSDLGRADQRPRVRSRES